jgi:hypothetical protein
MKPNISVHKLTNLAPIKTLTLTGTSPRTLIWDTEERLSDTAKVVLVSSTDLTITLSVTNLVEGGFGMLVMHQNVSGTVLQVVLPNTAVGLTGTLTYNGALNKKHTLFYRVHDGSLFFYTYDAIQTTSINSSLNDKREPIVASVNVAQLHPSLLVGVYDIPPAEKVKLENFSNWTFEGAYIGPPIQNTYQGQEHYDNAFEFKAVADNTWIRKSRS